MIRAQLVLTFRVLALARILNTLAATFPTTMKAKQFQQDRPMEGEPNLIISSASQHIVEGGVTFKVNVCKLEGGDGWPLEVVSADGTSIVRSDLFKADQAAFDEAVATIRNEGAVVFANCGSNVILFKK